MNQYKNIRPVLIILLAFFMITGLVACEVTPNIWDNPDGDSTMPDVDEIHEEIVGTREASQKDEQAKEDVDNTLKEPEEAEDLPAEEDEQSVNASEEESAPLEEDQTTDGDAPASGSEAAPAAADESVKEVPEEKKIGIAPGTYKGAFDSLEIRPLLVAEVQGTIADNEVTLVVSDSGAISGEMTYITEGFGKPASVGSGNEECIAYNNWEYKGPISGIVESTGGSIEAKLHKKIIYGQSDACSFDQSRIVESDIIVTFDLEGTDVQLSGVSVIGPDGRLLEHATFTVRK